MAREVTLLGELGLAVLAGELGIDAALVPLVSPQRGIHTIGLAAAPAHVRSGSLDDIFLLRSTLLLLLRSTLLLLLLLLLHDHLLMLTRRPGDLLASDRYRRLLLLLLLRLPGLSLGGRLSALLRALALVDTMAHEDSADVESPAAVRAEVLARHPVGLEQRLAGAQPALHNYLFRGRGQGQGDAFDICKQNSVYDGLVWMCGRLETGGLWVLIVCACVRMVWISSKWMTGERGM